MNTFTWVFLFYMGTDPIPAVLDSYPKELIFSTQQQCMEMKKHMELAIKKDFARVECIRQGKIG